MPEPRGEPMKVEQGTPPTPDNPYPSNQIRKIYTDGTIDISTPRPTAAVLAEYEQAIGDAPESADLRLHYGRALKGVDRLEEALAQVQEAARLAPEQHSHRLYLAALLLESGETQDAILEYQEALRLLLQAQGEEPGQTETIIRWGLGNALLQIGERDQARAELEQAIALQRELLSQGNASEQLLNQLEEALAEFE